MTTSAAGGVIFDVDGTLLDTNYLHVAARRAGIRGIGLLSGGIGEAELREAGATEIYADAAALLGKIPASVIGQLADP